MTRNPSAASQPIPEVAGDSLQRALSLPHEVWDCEGCNTEDSMRWRRSSLNSFGADDILLKCIECHHARTHGVEVDEENFEEEMFRRKKEYGGRIVDLNKHQRHTDDHSEVKELLQQLGYSQP